jgi:hypothetical protein
MREPRIHLPPERSPIPVWPKKKRPRYQGTFVLRLEVEGFSEEHCWQLAQACEDLLRKRAPRGVSFRPLEFRYGKWRRR